MQGIPIKDYEDFYLISTSGAIYSLRKRRNVAQFPNEKGYLRVRLTDTTKMTQHFVHRLVGKAFIPNPSNLPQINHINGDKSDNRVENLEWMSLQDNVKHAITNGMSPNVVCLSTQQISEALSKYLQGYTLSQLHAEYNVGVSLNAWIKEYAQSVGRLSEFEAEKSRQRKKVGLLHRKANYLILRRCPDTLEVVTFYSVKEASENSGVSRPTVAEGILNSSKPHTGVLWEKQYIV